MVCVGSMLNEDDIEGLLSGGFDRDAGEDFLSQEEITECLNILSCNKNPPVYDIKPLNDNQEQLVDIRNKINEIVEVINKINENKGCN